MPEAAIRSLQVSLQERQGLLGAGAPAMASTGLQFQVCCGSPLSGPNHEEGLLDRVKLFRRFTGLDTVNITMQLRVSAQSDRSKSDPQLVSASVIATCMA